MKYCSGIVWNTAGTEFHASEVLAFYQARLLRAFGDFRRELADCPVGK
jgi:hypothetical protein